MLVALLLCVIFLGSLTGSNCTCWKRSESIASRTSSTCSINCAQEKYTGGEQINGRKW